VKKMNTIKSLLTSAVCVIALAGQAKALDREMVFALQLTMLDHGFDSGGLDGRLGPATRRAIAGFAEKYRLPEDPEAMIRGIAARSAAHSFVITEDANLSDEDLEYIKESLAEMVRDPSSVQIKNVRLVEDTIGRFYCGEINTKNAYGGYTGFTHFHSLPTFFLTDTSFMIDDPDERFSFWECALAIPKKD